MILTFNLMLWLINVHVYFICLYLLAPKELFTWWWPIIDLQGHFLRTQHNTLHAMKKTKFIRSAQPPPVIPMNDKSWIFRNFRVPVISHAWALRIWSIPFAVVRYHCCVSQDYRRDSEPEEGVSLRRSPDTTASGNCFYYLCERQMRMSTEQSGNRLLRTMKPILMKPVLNSVMKILEPFSAENLFKLKSILFQKSTKNLKTFSSTYSSSA